MRLFVPQAPSAGEPFALPEGAARHAMVRRVQPGDTLRLFCGDGREWPCTVQAVTRSAVQVEAHAPEPGLPEPDLAVTLAVVMPANERMDWLVEKATELGAAAVQPLHAERSVLRLSGERAERKRAHWQGVAQAAAEQCGRAVVPAIEPVRELRAWLVALQAIPAVPTGSAPPARWLLSLSPGAQPPARQRRPQATLLTLSGPEGGFTPDEEAAARAAGFVPQDLGPRVLRAETAPLAVLAWAGLAAAA